MGVRRFVKGSNCIYFVLWLNPWCSQLDPWFLISDASAAVDRFDSGSDFRKLRQGSDGSDPFDLQRSKRLLYHYLHYLCLLQVVLQLACSGTPCLESGPI